MKYITAIVESDNFTIAVLFKLNIIFTLQHNLGASV